MSTAPASAPTAIPANSKPKNWLDWFNSRESAVVINKEFQNQLIQTFNSTISKEKCLEELIAYQECAFLFKENFGTQRVQIAHHFVKKTNMVYDIGEELAFIQGLHPEESLFLSPDTMLLDQPTDPAAQVPTIAHLLAITDEASIDALAVGATTTYKPRSFIPIVPFLLGTVYNTIASKNGSAKQVLINVVTAIKKFDEDHDGDGTYKDKAKSKCKDFLLWLYLVSNDNPSIKAVPTTVMIHVSLRQSLLVTTASAIVHATHDSEPNANVMNSLKRPFEIMAASAASNQQYLKQLTQIQEKSSDSTSKSFKKIPGKFQNMMKVASSVGEVTEVDLNPEAIEFFKSTTVLHANILLNSLLEAEGIDCSITPAMANSLWHGIFLWANSITPSGLAASVITTETLLRTDTMHEGLVLDYSTKFEMNSSALVKLTKSQVRFPIDVEGTLDRLRALKTLCTFFFSERSYPAQGITKLIHLCTDNKSTLKTSAYLDEEFYAKLIVAVDDRLHKWLKQCSNVTLVSETNVDLMDYESLFEDILMHRFTYKLPPNIMKLQQLEPEKENEKTNDSPKDNKKGKGKDKPSNTLVRNANIQSDFKLRVNENWDTVFRNKSTDGPNLSVGCKPCLKYLVKGVCYSDCRWKASHGQLSAEDTATTLQYIKQLRGE